MLKQSDNDITLQTYDLKMQEYIDNTPQQINDAEQPWIDSALGLISQGSSILELGSGFGRNASYINEKGFELTCTDAVPRFVELLKNKGLNAKILNALKDDLGKNYDMVFANGVLVHFTNEETEIALDRIYQALKPSGIFAFSIKQGEGGAWTEEKLGAPRYFQYWQLDPLKEILEAHGFTWIAATAGETSLKNASWLYVIARKDV